MNFEIKEEFYVDGQPIKLISGAVHYFRISPTHWRQTLQNLQAMGCNCVETYLPWNLHEPQKGVFNFSGIADVTAFLTLAEELGLYIIVRPSPYICAEWDFGGLPAWLLADSSMRVRSQHPGYLQAVKEYYHVLLPKLVPFQVTRGGRLLLVQLENEYGSFGEDKTYLTFLATELKRYLDVPLVTSDGGWKEALAAGTLPQENVLATVNFGSAAAENFKWLQAYQVENELTAPYMCMEFWDGWFNEWGKPIIRRNAQETAAEAEAILRRGSINFYMFQGGTNFGFYNGCSAAETINEPQLTSYDYDAPLTEWGQPTEKYFALQKVIQQTVPTAQIAPPLEPQTTAFGSYEVTASVSLFATLSALSRPVLNDYTLPMEKIGQNFGYTLYRSHLSSGRHTAKLKVVDGADRVQLFVNQQLIATQYQQTLGEEIKSELTEAQNEICLLVENMGRNNYGPKLVADTQRKGIRGGVMEDVHYLADWEHYPLEFSAEQLAKIDFTQLADPTTPSFYRVELTLTAVGNTFLDCSTFGKGVVFVNGVNLGRYWHVGPQTSLFIPDFFWQVGKNEVIIFETEGVAITDLHFTAAPGWA